MYLALTAYLSAAFLAPPPYDFFVRNSYKIFPGYFYANDAIICVVSSVDASSTNIIAKFLNVYVLIELMHLCKNVELLYVGMIILKNKPVSEFVVFNFQC